MRLPVTSSIEIRTQCWVDRVAHECSGPRRNASSSSSSVISRAVPLTRTLHPAWYRGRLSSTSKTTGAPAPTALNLVPRLRAEDDGLVVGEVVDRDDQRTSIDDKTNPAHVCMELEQFDRLGPAEFVHSRLGCALHLLSSHDQSLVCRLPALRRAMKAAASARRDNPSFMRMLDT